MRIISALPPPLRRGAPRCPEFSRGPAEPAPSCHPRVANSPWLLFSIIGFFFFFLPVLEFDIIEIVLIVNFHVSLLSLSVMLSRVTHAVAGLSSSLLVTAK